MDNIYYVYQYLREDGTPYYIGKGKNNRAWSKDHSVNLPPIHDRIVIIRENMNETAAYEFEIELIAKYGRKDNGSGILRNMTNGGEGCRGRIHTVEAKSRISSAKTKWHLENDITGENNPMYGRHHSDKIRIASYDRAIKHGFIGNRNGSVPWNKGKSGHLSDESRTRMSESRLKTPKKQCPHCSKMVAPNIFVRFHNDNCKHKS
jgi:hypothetical protein